MNTPLLFLPASQEKEPARSIPDHRILTAKKIIEENRCHKLLVRDVARQSGLTMRDLQKGFKQMEGMTMNKYQTFVRMKRAVELLLQENKLSVYKIGLQIGFDEESSFTAAFKKIFQLTPFQYRKKHLK